MIIIIILITENWSSIRVTYIRHPMEYLMERTIGLNGRISFGDVIT